MNYPLNVLRYPFATLLVAAILSAALSAGLLRLTVSTDLRVYFSPENPQLAALNELEDKYRRNESLFFLVQTYESVFTTQCVQLIHNLTEAAWRLPYAFRVASLSNYQFSRSYGDELKTRAIVEDPANIDPQFVREIVRQETPLRQSVVSEDGTVSGIAVLLALPEGQDDAVNQSVTAARKLIIESDSRDCGRIMLAGSAANSVALGEAVKDDIFSLVIISYLAITVGLILLLRNVWATTLIMVVTSLSVTVTMGMFGWLGFRLSPTAGFVPSIILTIAVADCVHIVSNYLIELANGRSQDDAIRESIRINLAPIFITTVTTAIGVLSLNLSDSPPYRDLGNMVACGVVAAFLLSLTVLPAALKLLPAPTTQAIFASTRGVQWLAEKVVANSRKLLVVGSILLIVITSFVTQNRLTENWHEYFTPHYPIRHAVDVVDEKLGGIHRIYYDLETGIKNGIYNPEYARQLQDFSDWLDTQHGVRFSTGMHVTLKLLNRALRDNNEQAYRLPESREAIAQFLLLYELSLPQGESIDNLIDQDRSATRFIVAVSKTDSESLLDLDRRAVAWLQQNATTVIARSGTGLDMIFAHITHRNIRSMLLGTGVALLAISLLLMLALRSVRLGLISLLPNLAPAALAYGFWGMTVGRIDLALSVVICMSLGIVVDDTVHFVSKYRRGRVEHGLDAADGIRYSFRVVGMALVITSAVLFVGFSILTFSNFNPTRETGGLLALTIALALIVDFLLLPPLLLIADRKK
ncbi:MAG: MMPL family transporter [Gammaproteobacteria bacterium]|nr:MMPL family transporter [Gammaproteobacteria bacterium]